MYCYLNKRSRVFSLLINFNLLVNNNVEVNLMYDNIGINKEKRLNYMKKRIRIPKITNRNYYIYSYDYDNNCCEDNDFEDAYKDYYENEYDYENDEYKENYPCDAFCEDYEETCRCTMNTVKKLALVSAGVLVCVSAISLLLSKRR